MGPSAGVRGGDNHPAERVLAPLFGRGCQAQQLGLWNAEGYNFAQFEPAFGQRSCLVERERPHARQPFQCRPPFDEHARPRQPTQGGDDGRGRSQHQRTRTCHHQDRQGWVDADPHGRSQGQSLSRRPEWSDLVRDVERERQGRQGQHRG
jgi:hypothetical protein